MLAAQSSLVGSISIPSIAPRSRPSGGSGGANDLAAAVARTGFAAPSRQLSCKFKKWQIGSSDQAQARAPAPAADDESAKTAWQECVGMLKELDFSADEADAMLKKAFGWAHSPYWSEERPKEHPDAGAVSRLLRYIAGLGLSDDDTRAVLKKFPEVLGCDMEKEVKPNVRKLDGEWGIAGASLRSLLLRNPKVLGYNVDCRGDCMAQCTRCWVRF